MAGTLVTAFTSPSPLATPSGQDIPLRRAVLPQRLLLRSTTTRSKGARRNAFFVAVSLVQFRLWWLVFFALHSICICYFTFSAFVYWVVPGSFTGMTLEYYQVTMPMRYFPLVAVCHGLIAVGHAFFLLRMLISSVLLRRFTFGRPGFHMPKDKSVHGSMQRLRRHSLGMKLLNLLRNLNELWVKIFSRRGFFGIESKHFDVLFIARELLESSLQSAQAYRMSVYVPRVVLNRCYVVVIVVNCLASPLVQHLYASNPPLARLLCLVLDILLDFESSVAIPIFLILPYRADYDFENNEFTFMLWYDDFWFINTINEFKLLFVNSWADLVARVFFSVSLLIALQSVKSLLRKRTHRVNPNANLLNSSGNRSAATSSFVSDREQEQEREQVSQSSRWRSSPPPLFIQQFAISMRRTQSAVVAQDTLSSTSRTITPSTAVSPHPLSKKIAKISHVLFSIWGIGVLALHLRGEFQLTSPECGLSVRPWFSSKVACALMQINCKTLNLTCSLGEMDAILSEIDEHTLAHIVIRHCPAVEISPRVQNFSRLVGMKIYNSTLVNWGHDAALTGTHHPHIVFLFLVHVNMSSFPEGLLSDEFPKQLRDVEFSGTNLSVIPDNLHLKWPTRSGTVNCFEQGMLKIVPPVIEHLKTGFLSLVSNEITEIPSYIFTNDNAFTIWLSDNPIEKLPETLVPSTSIRAVHLANTGLKSLPTWMDDHFFTHSGLNAGGSPFCVDLLAVVDASSNGGGDLKMRMDISAAALTAFAAGSIDCESVAGDRMTYYPSIEEATLDVPRRKR